MRKAGQLLSVQFFEVYASQSVSHIQCKGGITYVLHLTVTIYCQEHMQCILTSNSCTIETTHHKATTTKSKIIQQINGSAQNSNNMYWSLNNNVGGLSRPHKLSFFLFKILDLEPIDQSQYTGQPRASKACSSCTCHSID